MLFAKKTEKIYWYTFLAIILFLHVAAWFLLKPVWPHSDDECYLFNARLLLSGDLEPGYGQFQNRLGVFFPVSGLIALFGESPYVISLWPLLLSLFTVIIVAYWTRKHVNNTISLTAAFLIAANTLQVTYAIALFPDLMVSFYAIAAVLLCYQGRISTPGSWNYPVLLTITVASGFLTKETMVLIVPYMFVIFLNDWHQKKSYQFWKYTFISTLVVIISAMVFYYFFTGDPFHRIKSMWHFAKNNLYDNQLEIELKALYPGNFIQWWNGRLGYVFISILAIFTIIRYWRQRDSFIFFISLYGIITWLLLVLFYHLPGYGIVFRQERIWMMLIPPFSLLAAVTCDEINKFTGLWLFLIFLTFSGLNYWLVDGKRAILFLLFSIAFGTHYFFKPNRSAWKILPLISFLLLLIYFVYNNSNYKV